jgi:hypothetical protein
MTADLNTDVMLPYDPFGIEETISPSVPPQATPGVDLATLQQGATMSTTRQTSGPGVATWEEFDSILQLANNVFQPSKVPPGSTPAAGDGDIANVLARLGLGPAKQAPAPPAVTGGPAPASKWTWAAIGAVLGAVLGFLAGRAAGAFIGLVLGAILGSLLKR